jgi:hypothetical protein
LCCEDRWNPPGLKWPRLEPDTLDVGLKWPAGRPFDIVIGGTSPAAGRDHFGPLADLGITWWDERTPWCDDIGRAEPILRRIEQGPPRI